jgi:pyridoxine 5-phosphate synthase
MEKLRLGVNIDHVATIRNARGGAHPDPVRAAQMAASVGADGITAHLREDRRHISDADIFRLKAAIELPLNLEMAATPEMLDIALKTRPNACCIVPEKRQEITTEGGLDVVRDSEYLKPYVDRLLDENIRVSIFVDPEANQIEAAHALKATIVEIHTGMYCHATGQSQLKELKRIQAAAALSHTLGMECHAGHGISFDTVGPIAAIPQIVELNIGHFLIGEAIFTGLENAIFEMRRRMDAAR